MSASTARTNLYDISDDSLIEIFQKCDIETLMSLIDTCKRFKTIIKKYIFPKWNEFELEIDSVVKHNKSGRIIKNIGIHLKRLTVVSYLDLKCLNPVEVEYVAELFKEISKWTGDNLRWFKIGEKEISELWFQALTPVFERAETVILHIPNSRHDFCPVLQNTKHLMIEGDNGAPISPIRPISSLESLSVPFLPLEEFEVVGVSRQLKRLKLDITFQIQISAISKRFPKLEELVIYPSRHLNFSELQNLKNLTKLRLHVNAIDSKETLQQLRLMVDLRSVKLEFTENRRARIPQYTEELIAIARNIKYLEEFSISNTSIDENDILDFVKIAENLKIFHIHNGQIKVDDHLLRQIDRTRGKNMKAKEQILQILSEDENLNKVSVKY